MHPPWQAAGQTFDPGTKHSHRCLQKCSHSKKNEPLHSSGCHVSFLFAVGWIWTGISNFLSPCSCIPGEAANISGRQWVACLGYLLYDELLVYLAMHIAWTYMCSSNIKYFCSPNFRLFFLPVSSWKQWNKNLTQKAWPKISENLVQQKLPVFYTFLAILESWIKYLMRSFQNLLVLFKFFWRKSISTNFGNENTS